MKFKRFLSFMLTLTMVFSAVSGLSIVSGAENSEITEWKFLWVVVREVEAAKNNKIYTSSTSTNQSSVLKNSIIPNFEDYIYEYSNNLMKVSSTFTEVSKISSLSDNGSSEEQFPFQRKAQQRLE